MKSLAGRVGIAVIAAVLVGGAAGLVWELLAQPGSWEVTDLGLALDEEASQGQFAVLMVFALVGAVAGLVWGAALAWWLRQLSWPLPVFAILGSLLAGVIAWRVGVHLGPPAPASVTGLSIGDTVPDQLRLDTFAPFLAWPVGALAGVLLGTWGGGEDQTRPTEASTASVSDARS